MSNKVILDMFVPGYAAPGGSKTGFIVGGKVRMKDAGKRNAEWRALIAYTAVGKFEKMVMKPTPLEVRVIFYVKRPKSHRGKSGLIRKTAPCLPTSPPDATKLWRAAEDALTGIVWEDDSQIVTQRIAKRYAPAIPGMSIEVFEACKP